MNERGSGGGRGPSRSPPFKCLYCASAAGPFTKVEHPIPESLGNDDSVLPPGFVCDACNQYFGSKLERDVLSSPPFSIERVSEAIMTKRGTYAKYLGDDFNLFSSGYRHTVILEPRMPHVCTMLQSNPPVIWQLLPRGYRQLISRFMVKIGLGLLAQADDEDVYHERFDPAREHARYGKHAWQVAIGTYPHREHLTISTRSDEIGSLETYQIYHYEMGKMADGQIIFGFMFLVHLFACSLTPGTLESYVDRFNAMNTFKLSLM